MQHPVVCRKRATVQRWAVRVEILLALALAPLVLWQVAGGGRTGRL